MYKTTSYNYFPSTEREFIWMRSYMMTERDTVLNVLLGVGYGVNIRKRAM